MRSIAVGSFSSCPVLVAVRDGRRAALSTSSALDRPRLDGGEHGVTLAQVGPANISSPLGLVAPDTAWAVEHREGPHRDIHAAAPAPSQSAPVTEPNPDNSCAYDIAALDCLPVAPNASICRPAPIAPFV